MEAYQEKQMSEKNFVPNVAPIASSGINFFSRVDSSWWKIKVVADPSSDLSKLVQEEH